MFYVFFSIPLAPSLTDFSVVWPIISVYLSSLFLWVFFSQYFGHFLTLWISLSQIFIPTLRPIVSPTSFSAIEPIIPLFLRFTSLSLAIFPTVWSLFQPFSLSPSNISTYFHAQCFFHRFSSTSVNFSPTSYIRFSSLGKSFQFFGQFFRSI